MIFRGRAQRTSVIRALITTLILSFFQSVAAPIVAPHLAIDSSYAADANDFPTGLGTVYRYLAESYTSGATTWPEASGGTAATISSSATKVTNTAGTLGASKAVVAVRGSYLTTITFPTTIAYGNATNPADYTFLYVARYAPQQAGYTTTTSCSNTTNHTVNNADKRNRIFSSLSGNWLSGFWACAAGVAYHEGWVTQLDNSISELSGSAGNNWLLGADCGYKSSSTSTCNGRYRAFGVDRTVTAATNVAGHQVVVNTGNFPNEVSDFEIAEVISYPTILATSDIIKVETYLARKYGISLSASSANNISIFRSSVGSRLGQSFPTQPQIVIRDANGQTVTSDNTTVITATVSGTNGQLIGTSSATAIQGIATFDNLGVNGTSGQSYTITYSASGYSSVTESRTFTGGSAFETDTALTTSTTSRAWVANNSAQHVTNAITLEAWVYPTSYDSARRNLIITKDSEYTFGINSAGKWMYEFKGTAASWVGIDTGVTADLNEWHHVAVTRATGATTANFYLDGTLIFTGDDDSLNGGVFDTSNAPLVIGGTSADGVSFSGQFSGQIDQVAVFTVDRSAAQIKSDMHSYISPTTTGLLLYYDFNEGSGTTIYNRASTATSATDLGLNGSPTWSDVKIVDSGSVAGYTVVKFPRSYLTAFGGWKVPSNVSNVSLLAIGGGGGGGSRVGGGGGAGGYLYRAQETLTPSSTIAISVGQGGLAGRFSATTSQFQGNSGQNTVVGTSYTLLGGGGGGGYNTTSGTNSDHVGLAGGSAGGSTAYLDGTNPVATASTQNSTYGYGLGNSGGTSFGAASGYYPAGGGGGAGGAGGTPSGNNAVGNGGAGQLDPIGGSTICYAAGGGGGIGNFASGSAGGAAGTCAGGITTATAGTKALVVPADASVNSGSGGGGAGYFSGSSADVSGGSGASGVVIVKWLSTAKPSFTGPSNDTTTAGLTYTFSVTGTPLDGMTRAYKWIYSTDTGTTWTAISSGTGFLTESYTTTTLETTTSGSRYQYAVVITDTAGGSTISDTSTGVYLIINARISISGSYAAKKYGLTRTDTFTATLGTGNKTFKRTSSAKTNITWDTSTVNMARVTVGAGLIAGTYYDTITASDEESATTTLPITIVVSKADTVTIIVSSRNDTYTASALTYIDTFTTTGLVSTDSFTVTSYQYSGTANDGTAYSLSTRPILAGSFTINPVYTLSNASSYETVTITTGTLTINRATRSTTITTSPLSLQYGSSATLAATVDSGTAEGTLTFSTSTPALCSFSGAVLTALDSIGDCYYTATKGRGANYETSTSAIQSTYFEKANALTVTINAITPFTYSGNSIQVNPKISVSGLVLSDTTTANSATFSYASATRSCALGGACAIGDIGPGGGVVFYDAGSKQSWGQYLEAAPSTWYSGSEPAASWCTGGAGAYTTYRGASNTAIGAGKLYSYNIADSCTGGAVKMATQYSGGGKSDWYLPTVLEIAQMYAQRSRISLNTSYIYWTVNDTATGTNAFALNAATGVSALSSKPGMYYVRPIRAFSQNDDLSQFSSVLPVNADTYTVRADALTLTSGNLDRYLGVNYQFGSFRVNRATQSNLVLAQYSGLVGTPYTILVFGGSGTGAVTETVTASGGTTCTLSGDTITVTSVGTCYVTATKAQSQNYETATVSAWVYFLTYIPVVVPVTGSGSSIGLNSEVSITRDPNAAPTITSVGSSGDATYIVAINGAGFSASTNANTTIKFWRNVVLASNEFIIKSDTLIWAMQPLAATTGRILVSNQNGAAASPGIYTPIVVVNG